MHQRNDRRLPDCSDLHVGLDLDGTLYDHLVPICNHVAATFDIEFTPDRATTWDDEIAGTDGYTLGDAIRSLDGSADFYRTMPAIPGAVNAVQALADANATISIVTHRGPDTHEWTREALTDHDIPYDHFVETVPKNKADIDADIDVLIDDRWKNVVNVAEAGIYGILFVRPYNCERTASGSNVIVPVPEGETPESMAESPKSQWEHVLQCISGLRIQDGSADTRDQRTNFERREITK